MNDLIKAIQIKVGEVILNELIEKGLIKVDEYEQYIGKASDGTGVLLGWNKESACLYLAEFPDPEDW